MDQPPNDKPNKNNDNDNENDSPSKDKLFDPSVDMLVNDFDDERTLEEEEAMAAGEATDPSAELSSLQKEGNMPLDELLALYGYNVTKEGSSSSEPEEIDNTQDTKDSVPDDEKEDKSLTPTKKSKLSVLYDPLLEDGDDSSKLPSSVSRVSDDEEEFDSSPEDEEYPKIRRTIMVGNDYQAQVPEGLYSYGNTPPYENPDKLLWNPDKMQPKEIEEFLIKAREINRPALPRGNALRDDEQALYTLEKCAHDSEEALRRLTNEASSASCSKSHVNWSEEECRNFESGVRSYGKDFHLIQQNKVKTRSVGELVQFYYIWKKTERHDMFASKVRLEKKKYALHPGLTDFMDRFLEDQDKEGTSMSTSAQSSGTNTIGKPPDT